MSCCCCCCWFLITRWSAHAVNTQLAFYVNLHRAVIGPSATLTGRWRPDIDLRRMLTGYRYPGRRCNTVRLPEMQFIASRCNIFSVLIEDLLSLWGLCRTCFSMGNLGVQVSVRSFVSPSVRFSVNIYPGCLMSATPLTVLYGSFWNFACVLAASGGGGGGGDWTLFFWAPKGLPHRQTILYVRRDAPT